MIICLIIITVYKLTTVYNCTTDFDQQKHKHCIVMINYTDCSYDKLFDIIQLEVNCNIGTIIEYWSMKRRNMCCDI